MSRRLHPGAAAPAQRGVATLAVAMLLVFGMAAVVLFAHRHLVFEQRTSANHYRSTRAFEMAEAGLEWATARLNDPRPAGPACEPVVAGPSLRERLLRGTPTTGFEPDVLARMACRAEALDWVCSCPASGQQPVLPAVDGPVFSVRLEAVAEDPSSVRVVAIGCSDAAPPCLPQAAREAADAQARTSVVLKASPLLRWLPSAALTAAGRVDLDGGAALVNTATDGTGRLVDAGGAVTTGSASLETLPGSPTALAMLADDPALARLHAGGPDAVHRAWFGRDTAELHGSPLVRRVDGDTPAERGARLRQWHDAGFHVFLLAGETLLDGGELGSPQRPVLLLGDQPLQCAVPPCRVHGLVHGSGPARRPGDLTDLAVRGAVSTTGDHTGASDLRVEYDPQVLLSLRHQSSVLHRVPGSWRDF